MEIYGKSRRSAMVSKVGVVDRDMVIFFADYNVEESMECLISAIITKSLMDFGTPPMIIE